MKNITALERTIILCLGSNNFNDAPGEPVWSDSILESDHGREFTGGRKSLPGVVSSLHKKGLADSDDIPGEETTWLTSKGIKVYEQIVKEMSSEGMELAEVGVKMMDASKQTLFTLCKHYDPEFAETFKHQQDPSNIAKSLLYRKAIHAMSKDGVDLAYAKQALNIS